jgi:hypothetical protein
MAEPLKWKKYELLCLFGLLNEDDLQRDIKRYTWAKRDDLLRELHHVWLHSVPHETTLHVIKLVTDVATGQLPNHRTVISGTLTATDVESALSRVSSYLHSASQQFDEVWWCCTDVSFTRTSTAGRILFQHSGAAIGQVIEVVSRASPRMIESIGTGSCRIPYVRAHRYEWGFHWNIEDVLLGLSKNLVTDFFSTCLGIEESRDRIELFADYVSRCGHRAFSLEFKLLGNQLLIIDWDTSNDLLVLRHSQ